MSTTSYGPHDTVRLTVTQAIVKFLEVQQVERDGHSEPFFGGVLGIFGHGNCGGLGQALLEEAGKLRFIQGRNEQGMGDIAIGYAKMRNRLGAMAVTTSIGPGSANLVTAAGTATSNRLPLLLFPSDIFATRRTGSVLQQIEDERGTSTSTNDSLRSVSRFWERINRPEQLANALLGAMRTLTDPANTGAVTISLPQDVQAEAYDFPAALLAPRTWHVDRNRADVASLEAAAKAISKAEKPVIIAGGGVIYSDATEELKTFVEATGIPVGVTQSGKASLPFDHELAIGAIGSSGMKFANRVGNEADLVIGIGTRYTDFTSASNTLFQNPDATFVNINVFPFDAQKESAIPVVGDARESLKELTEKLKGWTVPADYRAHVAEVAQQQRDEVATLIAPEPGAKILSQTEVVGIVNEAAGPRDVVLNAAGSIPGDLHRLWKPGSPLGYGVEYGYSCMGYEIPAGLGMRIGDPSREIFTFIGDGSFLMYHQDVLTAIQEQEKIILLVVDNKGFGSINSLSVAVGSQGFETTFFHRGEDGRQDTSRPLEIDFAAILRGYGVTTYSVETADELREALDKAKAATEITAIYVPVDPVGRFGSEGFWEVATPEVSHIESSQKAHEVYMKGREQQRLYVEPATN
ncbi:3D-(3,5/4)-trihydroxycyclohexane-1,2-dione acylhydrolase (decyclizing) [Acidipropionibacterium jensenii]|uniref:3D-(3,5/4)-trihydroxycyclohexane-1,2-dione hydrolase n=1 Tax=Acidipropionibacterium jensenii TaxID=1749 RepID=A0A3S4UX64_9ACTN|nr:3D-(3,5/4)-trihydroxycyclohexane-1,2-dione acylhydrolase (decyclizing) [Acidipropionibacterium jensenii]MDN5977311.1 3D-(3,5/4)-trihydroxycyclohexane-1,2-dione acylhydrolase (decyclizing) [Acidipropionibacterium jensenii]MDN5995948.1 3D-(3,5/4)-trihydroxycyclohexane-1,2-dione acylhydrolase (decyclizing) [Acidipropionibacterium jensenii]MDN6426435.1 3D-(3,5/4)-trihydroxycyclohexane-1,2-dione acylhydrolase (decyclizing) [Acidipropionibacterium jensenii]MDN6442462.1 3D-(3,5/4)-trihydroxycyclohe